MSMEANHKTDTLAQYTAEDVYQILRGEIISLRLLPGSVITEMAVSSRFGLSRTPIRSVFAKLSQEGLLDLQGRKGTFVSLINLDMAEQTLFLRTQVEYGVMRYICLHPDAILFSNLKKNLDLQQQFADGLLPADDFYRVDSEFHGMCMESAGKLRLWQIIQGMDVHYARYRRLDYSTSGRTNTFSTLHAQHEELLELMKSRQIGPLYRSITEHLYSGMLRIGSDLFQNYNAYFSPSSRSIHDILRDFKIQINDS